MPKLKIQSVGDRYGYNVATGEYEDLVKAGVVDPTKVTRMALQNAASIAGLLLMIECTITEIPDGKSSLNSHATGAGMDHCAALFRLSRDSATASRKGAARHRPNAAMRCRPPRWWKQHSAAHSARRCSHLAPDACARPA